MGLFDGLLPGGSDQSGWLTALLQNPNLMNAGGISPSNGFDAPAMFGGPGLPQSAMGGGYGGGVFSAPPQMPPQAAQSMAQAQQQPMQQPQAAPQQPGFGDRLMAGFSNLESGGNPISALANVINGFATGQRTDRQGIALQQQKAAYEALVPKLGPAGAMAAVQNPKILEEWAKREFAPYSAHNVGDVAGSFNPQSGAFKPQYQAPKYEKVGAGEKLIGVGGGVPGAGGNPREVASGGPEKPPTGYDWVDKNNPAAGLTPIAGGPEAKIPANEAGYLAMMQASKQGVANARKFFLDPSFKGSTTGAIGSAVGQALNAGDIGRAQRDIKMATETALRIMTGAAAPETEVKRYADMFTPSVYDAHETRLQKMNNLENFLSQAGTNMRAGRVAPPDSTGWVNVGNGARIREKK